MDINYQIKKFDIIDSTNDEAKRLIKKGKAKHGMVVWALTQENGHGRYTRKWISPIGNLYFSVILKCGYNFLNLAQISFLTTIAIGKILAEIILQKDNLNEAVDAVSKGFIIGIPTETVYGIGVDPYSEEAVKNLFTIKERDDNKG